MAHLHTYETTYEREDSEGNVTGSLEVRFKYTFQAGRPAQISGPPEDCYPAEGPEIEIRNVHVETTTIAGGQRWFDALPHEHEMLEPWAIETLWGALVENAIEAAQEHAYETRRELQMMGNE